MLQIHSRGRDYTPKVGNGEGGGAKEVRPRKCLQQLICHTSTLYVFITYDDSNSLRRLTTALKNNPVRRVAHVP